MHMNQDQLKTEILTGFLKYPGESLNVDYKAAINFNEKEDFSLKLIKHIIGFHNTGGGYIIIGFRTIGKGLLKVDENLTEEVSASYEPTKVSQFVNGHLKDGKKISFKIYVVPFEGKNFPIIDIENFKRNPAFCGSTKTSAKGESILKDGALYVRNSETKTVDLANTSDWEKLIELTVQSRHSEMLEKFRILLRDSGLVNEMPIMAPQEQKHSVDDWFGERRDETVTLLKNNNFGNGFFEVAHKPINLEKEWGQKELLEIAEKSTLHNTGWPIGVVIRSDSGRPLAVEDGIKEVILTERYHKSFDYWYFRKDGKYYFARNFQEDVGDTGQAPIRVLFFDIRIWRIAEAINHCIKLYTELGLPPGTKLYIRIEHKGLKNRTLTSGNQRRRLWEGRTSVEDSSVWE